MSSTEPEQSVSVLDAPADLRPSQAATGPAFLATSSALLLWCAFPPADWGGLGWVALAPLFYLVKSEARPRAIYLGAWLGGFVFWMLAIDWVRLTDDMAWIAWVSMALALSAWWPGFLAVARLATRRLKLPLMLAAPIIWVGLEHVRAYVLTGFPWYYLAHSQHASLPVIQIADFAGSLGVSFVVATVNAWIVELITTPLLKRTPRGTRPTRAQTIRLLGVGLLLSGTLGYGAFRLSTASFRPGPVVSLLQSSMVQRLKMHRDANEQLLLYARLIREGLAEGPDRPDLIIWPETSYPYRVVTIDPKLSAADFENRLLADGLEGTPAEWRESMEAALGQLHGWTDAVNTPMLMGLITHVFGENGYARYNTSMLFEPGERATPHYFKVHLVAFGEYVPLIKTLPWLTYLTPYRGARTPSLGFGPGPGWIDLKGWRLAPAICFEDTIARVVRRLFESPPDGRQPDVIVNQSNDGWFQGSSEHEMHLAVSVFRTVENRAPLARAANTGVSAVVDGNGRVIRAMETLSEGALTVRVPLDDRVSLYSRWGDWLGLTCMAVTIGLLPLAWMFRLIGRPST